MSTFAGEWVIFKQLAGDVSNRFKSPNSSNGQQIWIIVGCFFWHTWEQWDHSTTA